LCFHYLYYFFFNRRSRSRSPHGNSRSLRPRSRSPPRFVCLHYSPFNFLLCTFCSRSRSGSPYDRRRSPSRRHSPQRRRSPRRSPSRRSPLRHSSSRSPPRSGVSRPTGFSSGPSTSRFGDQPNGFPSAVPFGLPPGGPPPFPQQPMQRGFGASAMSPPRAGAFVPPVPPSIPLPPDFPLGLVPPPPMMSAPGALPPAPLHPPQMQPVPQSMQPMPPPIMPFRSDEGPAMVCCHRDGGGVALRERWQMSQIRTADKVHRHSTAPLPCQTSGPIPMVNRVVHVFAQVPGNLAPPGPPGRAGAYMPPPSRLGDGTPPPMWGGATPPPQPGLPMGGWGSQQMIVPTPQQQPLPTGLDRAPIMGPSGSASGMPPHEQPPVQPPLQGDQMVCPHPAHGPSPPFPHPPHPCVQL